MVMFSFGILIDATAFKAAGFYTNLKNLEADIADSLHR